MLLSGVEGSIGAYSSEGVVGYGGFALERGAGTRPSCSSGFRSTMVGDREPGEWWCGSAQLSISRCARAKLRVRWLVGWEAGGGDGRGSDGG